MSDALRTFFQSNQVVVYAIYGQVFFTLGVILALQSAHYSRLRIAHCLPWLAAFGVSHGLHE